MLSNNFRIINVPKQLFFNKSEKVVVIRLLRILDNQIFFELINSIGFKYTYFIKMGPQFSIPWNCVKLKSLFEHVFIINYLYYCNFINFIKCKFFEISKVFFYEFIVRGIGYRYRFYKKNGRNKLVFKVGYGHKVFYNYLENVGIFILSNKRLDFIIASYGKSFLRTFSENLRSIKVTDIYKGKGIKYYRMPLKLKVGKIR